MAGIRRACNKGTANVAQRATCVGWKRCVASSTHAAQGTGWSAIGAQGAPARHRAAWHGMGRRDGQGSRRGREPGSVALRSGRPTRPNGRAIAPDPLLCPAFCGRMTAESCKSLCCKAMSRASGSAVQWTCNWNEGNWRAGQQRDWPGGYGPARPPHNLAPPRKIFPPSQRSSPFRPKGRHRPGETPSARRACCALWRIPPSLPSLDVSRRVQSAPCQRTSAAPTQGASGPSSRRVRFAPIPVARRGLHRKSARMSCYAALVRGASTPERPPLHVLTVLAVSDTPRIVPRSG